MALKAHSGPVLTAIGRPDVLPHLLCLQDGVGAEEAAQCLQVAVPALTAALAGAVADPAPLDGAGSSGRGPPAPPSGGL